MKNEKWIVIALVLSGSIGLSCQSMHRQGAGNRSPEPTTSSKQATTGRISQSDMQKVEQALKAKGYDPGQIDGKSDAQTQQALRDFQKKNNLNVSGVVDQPTAESLGIVIVFMPE